MVHIRPTLSPVSLTYVHKCDVIYGRPSQSSRHTALASGFVTLRIHLCVDVVRFRFPMQVDFIPIPRTVSFHFSKTLVTVPDLHMNGTHTFSCRYTVWRVL